MSHFQVTNCTVIPDTLKQAVHGVAIFLCEYLLRNCQSPIISIDECFKSIFIELQISKRTKTMSAVYM